MALNEKQKAIRRELAAIKAEIESCLHELAKLQLAKGVPKDEVDKRIARVRFMMDSFARN